MVKSDMVLIPQSRSLNTKLPGWRMEITVVVSGEIMWQETKLQIDKAEVSSGVLDRWFAEPSIKLLKNSLVQFSVTF